MWFFFSFFLNAKLIAGSVKYPKPKSLKMLAIKVSDGFEPENYFSIGAHVTIVMCVILLAFSSLECIDDFCPDFSHLHGTLWNGINAKCNLRAPTWISAWFAYLHHNDHLSGLQREYDLQTWSQSLWWSTERTKFIWYYGTSVPCHVLCIKPFLWLVLCGEINTHMWFKISIWKVHTLRTCVSVECSVLFVYCICRKTQKTNAVYVSSRLLLWSTSHQFFMMLKWSLMPSYWGELLLSIYSLYHCCQQLFLVDHFKWTKLCQFLLIKTVVKLWAYVFNREFSSYLHNDRIHYDDQILRQ